MRSANKLGADFVAIVGEDELRDKKALLKNMNDQSEGNQSLVSIDELAQILNGEFSC